MQKTYPANMNSDHRESIADTETILSNWSDWTDDSDDDPHTFKCSYSDMLELSDLHADITHINITYTGITLLPEILPAGLIELDISMNRLKKLPDVLPQPLTSLTCITNHITQLPDILPPNLTFLNCGDNKLTELPKQLPNCLTELHCSSNQLSALPNLSATQLNVLYAGYNQLTSIGELPASLIRFMCEHNKITQLPYELPPGLKSLDVSNNDLLVLPDFPDTMAFFDLSNNPRLFVNYPRLAEFIPIIQKANYTIFYESDEDELRDKQAIADCINYINKCNFEMKTVKRMAAIDPQKKILEHYMKRAMHPSRFDALTKDDTLDVDTYMTQYIDSL
jgi:Leucine-rich repeat (LRR) protein